MNTDKYILRHIGTICFRRCISNYEREMLNPAEQVCIDRCTNKYNQMMESFSTLIQPQRPKPAEALVAEK